MVRLTIDVDEKTFEAAEAKARQLGKDLSEIVVDAIRRDESSDSSPVVDDQPQEWDDFFAWLDGLGLWGRYRFGSREDIYVR